MMGSAGVRLGSPIFAIYGGNRRQAIAITKNQR
jgi:hypothetical protein